MHPRIVLPAAVLASLMGCGTVWEFRDDDGDGVSVAEGDCWDLEEGPKGSGLSGADIYRGAPDQPYDGIDADCAGNDDYDLDGDGWVPLDEHIGRTTLGVPGSGGDAHLGAGDCFDAPNDIVGDDDDARAALAAYAQGENALGAVVQVIAVPVEVDVDDAGDAFVQLRPEQVNPGFEGDDAWYDGIDADCDGADEFNQDGDVRAGSGEPWQTAHHARIAPDAWLARDWDAAVVGEDCIDSDGADPRDAPNGAGKPANSVNPDAEEVYWDGTDDDCDTDATRDCDYDGDDFRGDPTVELDTDSACAFDDGEAIDCNDEDEDAFPNGEVEVFYNGIEDNCDDSDQDGDLDGDGYWAHDYCARVPGGCEAVGPNVEVPDLDTNFDCWDDPDIAATDVAWPAGAPAPHADMAPVAGFAALSSADVHSQKVDRPYDGVDQDCRGWLNSVGAPADFDWDGDSDEVEADYSTDGTGTTGTDCLDCPDACFNGTATGDLDTYCTNACGVQDTNPAGLSTVEIYGRAYDEWYDGTDADCDDWSDYDADRDGHDHQQYSGGDCFEDTFVDLYSPSGSHDPTHFYPASPFEVVGDGYDHDCDSVEVCYEDDDDDGYLDATGDTVSSTTDLDCDDPNEGTDDDPVTDCDDTDAGDYPGATEVVGNEDDEDCDGGEICYLDNDNDGYRPDTTSTLVSSNTTCTDTREATLSQPTTDCDDTDAGDYPGATEIVGNEDDEDCDGGELCFVDADDDGYRPDATSQTTSTNTTCTDVGEATLSQPTTDCDDTDAGDYPGATEIVGNEDDEDCDGGEICYLDDDNDGFRPDGVSTIVSANATCTDTDEATLSQPTTDCDDDASTCTGDCTTDSDGDGALDCVDACTDADIDDYGTTNSAASACVDGDGASCVADAACTATDCNDSASTCTADCTTDSDSDGLTDCVDACDDEDGDNYGFTNSGAQGCSGGDCLQDAACTNTDCDDDASTCTTNCTSDADGDGIANCTDACTDDDGDNYGTTRIASLSCTTASGGSCVLDPACTATDCDDDASTCTTDCSTDSDTDGVPNCTDACTDVDEDNYGTTNSGAVGCTTAAGASCVADAACTATDCNDSASTCTADCTTDSDSDGLTDCVDACDDEDGDNYGFTNSGAQGCSGGDCLQDAACTNTDCDDDASTCTTNCTSDADGDGIANCTDACTDDDGDNYGTTRIASLSCTTASGGSCVLDPACTATDCDDDASTCTTDCSTDSDTDGVPNCTDACTDVDEDNYGTTNSGAVGCTTAAGASCVADAACTATDCNDNASTCTADCTTDADSDGLTDCVDACADEDADNYGATNAGALGCSGTDCLQDAACTSTDCDDDASTCTTDCATDADSDGLTDCVDACDDDDGDNYGVTNAGAQGCSGGNCLQDAACTSTDCNDDATSCTTDCTTDADSDGVTDCRDGCTDVDRDDHGVTNLTATACTGSACLVDAACTTTDCNDAASTCTTTCTDTDSDGAYDCEDGCASADTDNYGTSNLAAATCTTDGTTPCASRDDCDGTDCDDTDGDIHPGVDEGVDTGTLAIDMIDQDCDDVYDENLIGPGDLLVTEIMVNPTGPSETDTEWFELYNDSGFDILIGDGWALESDTNSLSITGPLTILDGAHALFARDASPGLGNHGLGTITANYEYGTGGSGDVSFLNSAEDYLYVTFTGSSDAGDDVIGAVTWGQTTGPFQLTPSSGTSLQLKYDSVYQDETDDSNWCDSTDNIDSNGSLDYGTPGTVNTACVP